MPEIDQKVWQEFQQGFVGNDPSWLVGIVVGVVLIWGLWVIWRNLP